MREGYPLSPPPAPTCLSLREQDNQGAVFCCCFFAVTMMTIELDQIVRGGEP